MELGCIIMLSPVEDGLWQHLLMLSTDCSKHWLVGSPNMCWIMAQIHAVEIEKLRLGSLKCKPLSWEYKIPVMKHLSLIGCIHKMIPVCNCNVGTRGSDVLLIRYGIWYGIRYDIQVSLCFNGKFLILLPSDWQLCSSSDNFLPYQCKEIIWNTNKTLYFFHIWISAKKLEPNISLNFLIMINIQ